MTRALIRQALALSVAATLAAPAVAEGPVGTLPRGSYACELPGDAAGPAGVAQADANFSIQSSSRYATGDGVGTYLRRGDKLVMSSGPRHGDSYAIRGTSFLRRVENGQPGRLRCVHSGN